jgi:hypothetical protein
MMHLARDLVRLLQPGAMSMPDSFIKAYLATLSRHVREYFPELPRGFGTKEGELLDCVADSSS